MSSYYLKTEDLEQDVNYLNFLKEIRKYIKEKYNINSSIIKREYIEHRNKI